MKLLSLKRKSTESLDNENPPKLKRLKSAIDWDILKRRILHKCSWKDGHLVPLQQHDRVTHGLYYEVRDMYVWWHMCKNQTYLPRRSSIRFIRTCTEVKCIEHWQPHQLCVESVRELDANQYLRAWSRFECKTQPLSNGCVKWLGTTNGNYGSTSGFAGIHRLPHIWSWELSRMKDVPRGLHVRHLCGYSLCVRPEHLEVGTAKENAADREQTGTTRRGSQIASSQISEEQARIIIESYGSGKSAKQRAQEMNVSLHVVQMIDSGYNWSHLMTEEEKDKRLFQRTGPKITPDQVRRIKSNADKSGTRAQRAKRLGVTPKVLKNIELGYSGKGIFTTPEEQESYHRQRYENYLDRTKQRIRAGINIEMRNGGDHWIWQHIKNVHGYGYTKFKRSWNSPATTTCTNVAVWLAWNYPKTIPVGMQVRHLCGIRDCCNPKCLALGTAYENAKDKLQHGTQVRGSRSFRTNLDEQTVSRIKASKGTAIQKERAKRFGTTISVIRHIDAGSSWQHV